MTYKKVIQTDERALISAKKLNACQQLSRAHFTYNGVAEQAHVTLGVGNNVVAQVRRPGTVVLLNSRVEVNS